MVQSKKRGKNIMKCPACGRGMLNRGTYFECSNFLCDYEEDVQNEEVLAKMFPVSSFMAYSNFLFDRSGGEYDDCNEKHN